jgi:tetratricopeptide (TPR) repeat protein
MHVGRFFNRLFIWILLTLTGIQSAAIAVTDDEIARAIKQLGAAEYKKREEASKFLWSAGRAALPALQAAGESSDPEVSLRARQLLVNIQRGISPNTPADVRDLLRRYPAADREGKQAVVLQLLDLGARAYPSIAALADSEPSLQRRVEIFQPALEQLGGWIAQALGGEQPDGEIVPQALAAIRLVQAIVPEDLGVPLQAVTRLDKLGKKKDADEVFETAFAFHQKLGAKAVPNPNPANDLAWLCAVCHRRLDDALTLAQKAVALEPKNPAFLDTLAEVHFQKGNRERALELMKQCIELAPDNNYFRQQRDRFEKGDPTLPPPEPE